MAQVRRRIQPFHIWYIKEYESYLEDMAAEGWRYVGNNRFAEDEGRPTRYRLIVGPRNLDNTLLAELETMGWSYAGSLDKSIFSVLQENYWHVFATEDPEALDSYFRQSLAGTLESIWDSKWKYFRLRFHASISIIFAMSLYWHSFFFAALPHKSLFEVLWYCGLIITSTLLQSEMASARKYVKQVYEQFGTSYPPRDWRQLAKDVKRNRIVTITLMAVSYFVLYFAFKAAQA
jgi:hypothetical protein